MEQNNRTFFLSSDQTLFSFLKKKHKQTFKKKSFVWNKEPEVLI